MRSEITSPDAAGSSRSCGKRDPAHIAERAGVAERAQQVSRE
jgi:hypothetical protein